MTVAEKEEGGSQPGDSSGSVKNVELFIKTDGICI